MKKYLFLTIIIFVLIASSCSSSSESAYLISSYSGTIVSSDMQYQVNVYYDTVEIIIESNPTTGYDWVYEIDNEDVMSLNSETYESEASELVGTSGEHTFVFDIEGDGDCEITLYYERSWEDEPIKEVSFKFLTESGITEFVAVIIE